MDLCYIRHSTLHSGIFRLCSHNELSCAYFLRKKHCDIPVVKARACRIKPIHSCMQRNRTNGRKDLIILWVYTMIVYVLIQRYINVNQSICSISVDGILLRKLEISYDFFFIYSLIWNNLCNIYKVISVRLSVYISFLRRSLENFSLVDAINYYSRSWKLSEFMPYRCDLRREKKRIY